MTVLIQLSGRGHARARTLEYSMVVGTARQARSPAKRRGKRWTSCSLWRLRTGMSGSETGLLEPPERSRN